MMEFLMLYTFASFKKTIFQWVKCTVKYFLNQYFVGMESVAYALNTICIMIVTDLYRSGSVYRSQSIV